MIVILKRFIENNPQTFEPESRAVYCYISNNGNAYMHTISGLPLTGALQPVLDANEAAHFTDAQAVGILPTAKEKATAEAITWFKANPATKQIFTLTPAALETQVGTLTDALFPGIGAATRNQKKKVWTAELMALRVSVAGELEDLGV